MAMPRVDLPAQMPPRVAVVDADRRVQQSLADVLRVTGGVVVVGSAGDARSALALIGHELHNVLVLDPRLPELQAGTVLVSEVLSSWPSTRIVVTGWGDDGEQPELAAAVSVFVSKSASPEKFVAAVIEACRVRS
jgi:DNA-binding NarL/FixJ family response regulator